MALVNNIHPTAIIGDQVKIGTNNSVGPYAVISGAVEIGDNNWIGSHSSIGGPAEIRGSKHPTTWETEEHSGSLSIGSNNVIREGCIIHAGYFQGTRIGNDCYIMNQAYIAHDCQISDAVTISSTVAIGGHAVLLDGCNLGLGAVVHQRRVIGKGAMIGMGSVITKDVPPYSLAFGNPSKIQGANSVGMNRLNLNFELISQVEQALTSLDIETLALLIPHEYSEFLFAISNVSSQ